MSEAHLTRDALEQYVIGALDAGPALEVERHVEQCEACAALLRDEARLEALLFDLAQLPAAPVVPARARRRWARPVAIASVAVAMAAGAALFVLQETPPPRHGEPRVVRCDDPRSADECLARARFDGLLSLGPGDTVEVPRYDAPPKRSAP